MTTILKIALVTEEAAGIRLLRSLDNSSHQICCVFCSPASQTLNNASVWNIAQGMGIHTQPVDELKQPATAQALVDANIDLLISVRSPAILNKDIIDAPTIGAFNLHTGPLPSYAGRNVISWAIFNGESTHGVTLHRLTPEIDGGEIIFESSFVIEEDATALEVTGKCIKQGIELVQKLITQTAENPDILPGKNQDNRLRRYYGKNIPNDGCIDWSWEAKQIVDFVRACNFYPLPSPWGHPQAQIGDQTLQLLSITRMLKPANAETGTVKVEGEKVLVACADEWLSIDEIIVEGAAQDTFQVLSAQ